MILIVQLLISFGCVALFLLVPAVKSFFKAYPQLLFAALVATIILLLLLIIFENLRRTWPWNLVILFIFTILQGILIGSIAVRFEVCFLQLDCSKR
jgi:FtsH-binding integral membrane protein